MEKRHQTFDYIVVGTGPAGAVIGKTLTDDKETSVLILESGDNNDKDRPIKDSEFALELEEQFFPQYFWQGEGIPQEELDDRVFEWTTGRLLGGGSSINGEQYVRPTSAVMREWQQLLGPMWSPGRAIHRFKKLERYNGKTNNAQARGFSGQIDIRQAPVHPTAMALKLTEAIEKATGYQTILDYNDPQTPIGPFTRWQLYQNPNGKRESSSTAFLSAKVMTPAGRGIQDRKLKVLFKSTVLRVLFSEKNARGIEYLLEGKLHRAYARKKVIISAGINSAQLLMLSGIGPANLLRDAGIPVKFNNSNVGKWLRNHTLNSAVFTTNPADRPLPSDDPNALYAGGAFLPDPTGNNSSRRAVQLVGIGSDHMLTLAIIYLRPLSRGFIKIQNNDPLKIVLADEAFLKNSEDMDQVKNIFRTYVKKIAVELASIDPAYRLTSPTPEVIDNDAKLEQYIKQNFEHNHHQQGSLRMGPLSKGGVVDRRGNVHGVKNLIVADASIIPYTVDGNTSAAAYLIGYTIARQLQLQGRKIRRRKVHRWLFESEEE